MVFKRYVFFIFLTLVFIFPTECTQKRQYLECSVNHFASNLENGAKGCLLYIGTQQDKTIGEENAKGLDREIYTFLIKQEMPENITVSLPQVKIKFTKGEWAQLNMEYDAFLNPTKDTESKPTIISKELMTVLLCFKDLKKQKHFVPRPIQHKILSFSSDLLPAYINNQHVVTNTLLMGCDNNTYQPLPIPGTLLLKRIPKSNDFELRRLF